MSHTKQTPILEYTDAELQSLTVPAGTITLNTTLSCLSYYTGQVWVNSDDWESTYTTVLNESGNWIGGDYDDSALQAASGSWDSTYSTVLAESADWDSTYTTVLNESGNWIGGDYDDSALQAASGSWDSTYTTVNAESSNWDSTYTTVLNESASWIGGDYDDSALQAASGNWDSTYTTVLADSADWDSTYTTVLNESASWIGGDYDDSALQAASGNWDSTYTTVLNESADWDSTYTTVLNESANWIGGDYDDSALQAASGDWNSTYTTVSTNSATWADHFDSTLIEAASGDWNSTYTTVSANSAVWGTGYDDTWLSTASADWDSTYTTVSTNSASWADHFDSTLIEANSADWDSTYTTVSTNSAVWGTGYDDTWLSTASADWESTYTTVSSNSATWADHFDSTLIEANSADWDSTYTTVSANSAAWSTSYDDTWLSIASGDWESTYTTVSDNSANWDAHADLTDIIAASGDWNSAYTTVNVESGDWESTYTTVLNESASWIGGDYDDSALQAASGNWDSTYTTVSANSASWSSSALPDSTGTVYVSKDGDPSYDGLTISQPVSTISDAITIAQSLITAGAYAANIEVLDSGQYIEDITLKDKMTLNASSAELKGQLTTDSNAICHANLKRHVVGAFPATYCVTCGSSTRLYYKADYIDTAGQTGILLSNGSYIYAEVNEIDIGAGGFGISNTAGGTLNAQVKWLMFTGNTGTAINSTTSGSINVIASYIGPVAGQNYTSINATAGTCIIDAGQMYISGTGPKHWNIGASADVHIKVNLLTGSTDSSVGTPSSLITGERVDEAHSSYTTVLTESANWDSTYTAVEPNSANWDSTYNTVSASSSDWDITKHLQGNTGCASRLFSGSNQYITVSDDNTLDIVSNLTVCAWIKPTTDTQYYIASKIDNFSGASQFSWTFATQTAGRLNIYFSSNGSSPVNVIPSTNNYLTPGEWQHVAFTYDGTNTRFYVNGALIETVGSFTGNIYSGTANLTIGRRSGSISSMFDGSISDVRIYDTSVLSLGDIQSIYAGGHISTNLQGWWLTNIDDGASTITDHSQNSNDGTNTGTTFDVSGPLGSAVQAVSIGGNTPPAEALDVTGNIAVNGTVDGRDVSVDGSKLDSVYTTVQTNSADSVFDVASVTTAAYTQPAGVSHFLYDASGGNIVVDLLPAANHRGVTAHKLTSATNQVTLSAPNGETIGDEPGDTKVITVQYNTVKLFSDGTQYWIE